MNTRSTMESFRVPDLIEVARLRNVQILALVTSLLALVLLLRHSPWKRQQKYADAPMVGVREGESMHEARVRFRSNAKSFLQEGYSKYKGQPFYVPALEGDKLIVPAEFVDELKNLPDEQTDAAEPVFRDFESRYTLLASRELLHRRTIRNHLYRNIDRQKDDLLDEVRVSIQDTIGSCDGWENVPIAKCMTQIVARIASRAFGGLKLSRNQAWIQAMIGATEDATIGSQKLKRWPRLLMPIAALFIPEVKLCKRHYEVSREIIIPMLEYREQLPEEDRPNDFLEWMTTDAQGPEKDKGFLADMQLNISFTALFTTTAATLQALYDLFSMPEYIQPLREEIEAVLQQHGTLDHTSLGQMHKLDSFMKESQRFNPLVLVTFTRYVWKDLLVRGFLIPAHTNIGFPAQAALMDPEVHSDPHVFDGFRFVKLREQADQDPASLQWAAASLKNMPFGYGRVSCPGRQFASAEVKMILASLLTEYDFGPLEGGRPESVCFNQTVLPDQKAMIPMRRRRRGV